MQSRRTGVPRRAIIGALALYALLVQALLAGFTPAKAHNLSGATSVLCSQQASGSPQDVPLAHQQSCCLAACFAACAGPASLPAAAAAWPSREATSLAWASAAVAPGIRPAGFPVNARGPPAV